MSKTDTLVKLLRAQAMEWIPYMDLHIALQDAATTIGTLQSELERERKRADEAERENKNLAPTGRFNGLDIYAWQDKAVAVQSRLDAIEAMALRKYWNSALSAEIDPLRAFILDGKEKL